MSQHYPRTCTECNELFIKKSAYHYHKRVCKSKTKCNKCGRNFTTVDLFKDHQKAIIKNPCQRRRTKCPYPGCEFEHYFTCKVLQHLEAVHQDVSQRNEPASDSVTIWECDNEVYEEEVVAEEDEKVVASYGLELTLDLQSFNQNVWASTRRLEKISKANQLTEVLGNSAEANVFECRVEVAPREASSARLKAESAQQEAEEAKQQAEEARNENERLRLELGEACCDAEEAQQEAKQAWLEAADAHCEAHNSCTEAERVAEQLFKLSHCQPMVQQDVNLARNKITEHQKIVYPRICEKCKKTYKNRQSFCRHKSVCRGILHPCEPCGRHFSTLNSLRAHQRSSCQNGRKQKISICPYKNCKFKHNFVHKVWQHIEKHHEGSEIMPVKVEKLPIPRLSLGEGPHWDTATESLYLVDINTSTIYRYVPSSSKTFSLKLDVPSIGFVTPVGGCKNRLVVGAGTSLLLVDWDGTSTESSSIEVLHKIDGEPATNRINDGKADPAGRLWFGTMRREDILNGRDGSFYSFTGGKGINKHLSNIGISNGLAWNLGKDRMYYIDSVNYTVDAFDYTCSSGDIVNRRAVLDIKKNGWSFFPDGQTIDTDGNLWVACYGGSRVLKVDPEAGTVLEQVDIPAKNVTSVAWGGPGLSELYVTSANDETEDSNAGGTFRVTGLSSSGHPMHNFKLN